MTSKTGSADSHWLLRVVVLGFVGLLTYGSYFAYDSVGALAPTLIKAWDTSQSGIGWLYTIYSVAAILSVFLGGMLIDRIGTRWASLLFSAVDRGGRRHGRLGLVGAGGVRRPVRLRRGLRVAGRGAERDPGALVHGARMLAISFGVTLDARPARHALQLQHRCR